MLIATSDNANLRNPDWIESTIDSFHYAIYIAINTTINGF